MNLAELMGALASFVLTIMVFSYVFGDNALFRIALHIFIGVASGFAVVISIYNVIWPKLIIPLVYGPQSERLLVLLPLLLGALLFFKLSARLAWVGNPAISYLLGVGVATAIGGAVLGTLFPQVGATMGMFDPRGSTAVDPLWLPKSGILLVGTLSTLVYFHYGARPSPGGVSRRAEWIEKSGLVGQFFIAVTFGVLFAGAYAAALAALIERIRFINDIILPLILPG